MLTTRLCKLLGIDFPIFLATSEANAHPQCKQKLLDAAETDTVRTILFGHGWPNAPIVEVSFNDS
jgi:hypothetical protein